MKWSLPVMKPYLVWVDDQNQIQAVPFMPMFGTHLPLFVIEGNSRKSRFFAPLLADTIQMSSSTAIRLSLRSLILHTREITRERENTHTGKKNPLGARKRLKSVKTHTQLIARFRWRNMKNGQRPNSSEEKAGYVWRTNDHVACTIRGKYSNWGDDDSAQEKRGSIALGRAVLWCALCSKERDPSSL